ncbi:MAG: iron ABC transporter permease [Lachnospiraceae bacterium]|nr:iron ABC transporter permease [Lachnospiraceae bacterium]
MNKKRCALILAFSLFLMLVLVFISILSGSVKMPFDEVLGILLGSQKEGINYNIIYNIRLPRAVAAVFLGGGLALSGYLLQTFFNNPIVGPFVLGISSGAKLSVALIMIGMLRYGKAVNSVEMVGASFLGAMLVMFFVLFMSLKVRNMSVLVVSGIMIGYICSAITDMVVTFADDSNIINLHNWSMGSLSGMEWDDVVIMGVLIILCFVLAFAMSKSMGAYRLGEAYARNMGVNIRFLRVMLILISSLLAACVTAFAGPVSFVGIAVPHLMRQITKTSSPFVLIPASFLGGAAVTVFCDCVARTVFAPTEVSISSVTAVFLVPVVIAMLYKRGRGN